MEIRNIGGRAATDRRGAAERIGRSLQTVKLLASRRTESGFPAPIHTEETGRGIRARANGQPATGREWYALDDLDQFKADYVKAVEAAGKARVHGEIHIDGDDDELVTSNQFAEILRIQPATFRSWIRDSKELWAAGKPGWGGLPDSDVTEPARRGVTRKWRLGTVRSYIRNRPGAAPSPGRPKKDRADDA